MELDIFFFFQRPWQIGLNFGTAFSYYSDNYKEFEPLQLLDPQPKSLYVSSALGYLYLQYLVQLT